MLRTFRNSNLKYRKLLGSAAKRKKGNYKSLVNVLLILSLKRYKHARIKDSDLMKPVNRP